MKHKQVQVIDFENTAYLPKGRCIKGMLAGNDSWCSSEGHFKDELSKPFNIFFFTAVDLQKHESQDTFPHVIHLQCQVSFLGDQEGLNRLMKHVGDEGVNCQVLGFLWDDQVADYRSYKPFSDWPNVNDDKFKDIPRMTNFDPQKRATAREVLEHPWLAGCELY
ncbi:calcium/calmodulin dependent protein kinase [Histoplasma capsulatum var. duboisii H88]|uniref:Calcium/calmodulin dependent protein kinase n=1 Tax=Ajellomyces capsulatus (strain H88) TaxID=544711 RepID=F0UCD3_AJEC8|nr:calcium/calmodulin dependent protein kinase [Histoplasma capsulatum var. duboisii H88]